MCLQYCCKERWWARGLVVELDPGQVEELVEELVVELDLGQVEV